MLGLASSVDSILSLLGLWLVRLRHALLTTCYVLWNCVRLYMFPSMLKLTAALAGPDGDAITIVPACLSYVWLISLVPRRKWAVVSAGMLIIMFLKEWTSLWPYGQDGLVMTILLLGLMASVAVSNSVVDLFVATMTWWGLTLIRRCLRQKLVTVCCSLGRFSVVAHGSVWLLHRLCTVLCMVGGVLKLGLFRSSPTMSTSWVTTLLVSLLNITVWNGRVLCVCCDTAGRPALSTTYYFPLLTWHRY